MITRYDVISFFEKAEKEGKDVGMMLDIRKENIMDNKTGEFLCTMDVFVEHLAKKLHCDFESIFYEHGTLSNVIRCKECGTVIFTGDDERYDPNLRCPTCGDYNTHLMYWTKEDIENDASKQAEIEALEKMQENFMEREMRQQRRKGKNDWEICKGKIKGKRNMLNISLECCDLFETGLKGLNLVIAKSSKKEEGDIGYTLDWHKRIPLSPYSVYLQCILPHTKTGKKVLSEML